MTDQSDQLKCLEAVEAFLTDLERALAEQGALSAEHRARFEELRRQCAEKKEELTGGSQGGPAG